MTKKKAEEEVVEETAGLVEYDAVGAIVRSGQSVLKVTSSVVEGETVVTVHAWLGGSTEGFIERLVHTSAEDVDAFAVRVAAAIVAGLGR